MHVFIFTQGCSANQSDSEVMAGILERDGHRIVPSPDHADVIVLNTCTVKSPTESKAFSLLKKWKGKKIVVAGCIAQSDPEKVKDYALVGTRQVHRITEAVEAAAGGRKEQFLDWGKTPRLLLPHVRKNPVIEIIPTNAGCLGSCAFCKTKMARGALYSCPLHDIVKQVGLAVKDGVKEVWLTSQDTGAYGKDIQTSLPALIRAVTAVQGDFKVRIGMMNPDLAIQFLPELIAAMKDPKVFKFLHIPVQSGSDKVLKNMRRPYAVADFEKIVARMRAALPSITIATDIIVGFPGENEEEFQETLALLERLRIPVVNISKFYPRPGTLAARMKKIPTHIVKARSTKVARLQKRIMTNEEWLGWEGPVLIDEMRGRSFIGRNAQYKQVVVRRNCRLGETCKVKVTQVTPIDVRGSCIVNDQP